MQAIYAEKQDPKTAKFSAKFSVDFLDFLG